MENMIDLIPTANTERRLTLLHSRSAGCPCCTIVWPHVIICRMCMSFAFLKILYDLKATYKTPVTAVYDGAWSMKDVMAESMTRLVMPPWVSRRTSFSLRIHCSRTCSTTEKYQQSHAATLTCSILGIILVSSPHLKANKFYSDKTFQEYANLTLYFFKIPPPCQPDL